MKFDLFTRQRRTTDPLGVIDLFGKLVDRGREHITGDVIMKFFLDSLVIGLKRLAKTLLDRMAISEQLDEIDELRPAFSVIPQHQVMREGPRLGVKQPGLLRFV